LDRCWIYHLCAAWEAVRGKRGAAVRDGVTLKRWGHDREANLYVLRPALLADR